MSKKDPPQKLSCFHDREEPVNPSQNQRRDSDWQFLCELDLRVTVDAEQTIQVWLTESLKPLNLPEDFINKVLRSAQRAVARTVQGESGLKQEHIHIRLFVPPEHGSRDQSWGFFRVEKISDAVPNPVAHGQMIAFYLYLEGH